jgi:hypothetical protein
VSPCTAQLVVSSLTKCNDILASCLACLTTEPMQSIKQECRHKPVCQLSRRCSAGGLYFWPRHQTCTSSSSGSHSTQDMQRWLTIGPCGPVGPVGPKPGGPLGPVAPLPRGPTGPALVAGYKQCMLQYM